MKKHLLFFLLCYGLLFQSMAQDRSIKGRVSAQDGGYLPGVNVILKETTVGGITDIDGNYEVLVPEGEGILVFSYVGYITQETEIGARSIIDMVLLPDVSTLSEIVVTAQGYERTAKSLGYAASTVGGEEFVKSSQVDPLKSLQGKVAGVVISGGGGAPNASSKVIIRGYSSVNGANNPLYVVDGFPINNSSRTESVTGLDLGNRANDINPNDIESMTVLKGTAATTLYGPRGSNGVIIITTKKGKAGVAGVKGLGLKVEINSSFTTSDVLRLPAKQNTFGQGWSGLWSRNENGSWGPKLDGATRQWGSVVDNSQKIKPFSVVEDNVYEFYDYGQQWFNSVSLSGGTERSDVYFSYSNSTTDGVVPTDVDKDSRHIFKLSGRSHLDKLSVESNISYVRRDGSLNPDGRGSTNAAANLYSELLQIPRDFSVVDFEDYRNKFNNPDNFYTPYADNPYYAINENQTEFYEDRVYGNFTVKYDFFKWLSAKWLLGTDVSSLRRREWENIVKYTPGSYQDEGNKTENPGLYLEEVRDSRNVETDFLISVNKQFGSFGLDAYLGFNARSQTSDFTYARINSLVIPGFYHLANTSGDPQVTPPITYASNSFFEKRLFAYYGSILLDYNDYIFIDFGARYDKSSTLPPGNNAFFYPKASLSLVVSDAVPAVGEVFDILKLRASVGQAGNDAAPYLLAPVVSPAIVLTNFSEVRFPIDGVGGYEISNRLGNIKLKPEITTEFEVGMQAAAFDNRLSVDLSVYERISDGQILTTDIAPSSGYSLAVDNFGKVRNIGLELLLTVVPVQTENFRWTTSGNFFTNTNEVYDLPDESDEIILRTAFDVEFVAIKGKPLAQFRAPDFLRDEQGRIVVNGSNGIPEGSKNTVIIGDNQSDFVLGWVNEFSYKDFNLSFTFDWRPGGEIYSGTADLNYFTGNATQTTFNERQPFLIPNSVKPNPAYDAIENPGVPVYIENDVQISRSNINAYYYHSSNATAHRDRVIPRGFLKLRDVNMSYNIPQKWLDKTPVSSASIYFSGRNLFLWTPKENNFIDPESTSYGNNLRGDFGEFRTGPTFRSFTFGLRATL